MKALAVVLLVAGCDVSDLAEPPRENRRVALCYERARAGGAYSEAAFLRCLNGHAAPAADGGVEVGR